MRRWFSFSSFHENEKAAEKEESEQDERWGESSVSDVTLAIIDGRICFQKVEYDDDYKRIVKWVELK